MVNSSALALTGRTGHYALVRRLTDSLSVAVLIALVVTACTDDEATREGCGKGASCGTTVSDTSTSATSQPTDTTSSVRSFSRAVSVGGLKFTLPAELQFRTNGFASTGEAIDAFYANVPLGSACSPGCGLPSFSPLSPGAVVVGLGVLSGFGAGAPNPADPAPNTSIAGQAAVFTADKPGNCGGDETISLWIPGPGQNEINAFLMRACLQGPDLTTAEQIVQTLLASAEPAGA
ncbi:MAG: hypothetical protein QOJ66_3151 [Ilumatobacteraceae bacterium]